MQPIKLNDCVATIGYVRYKGSAFVLPMPTKDTSIPNQPFDQLSKLSIIPTLDKVETQRACSF
jgi:hypothetical protein